jgi:hypothetical protein
MKKTIIMLMILLPIGVRAQSDEFGTWTSVSLDKKLSKQFSLGTELELRTGNNLKNIDRWSAGISVDYRLAKWLKASAGYTYLYDYHPEAYTYQDDGDLNKRTMTYFGSRHRLSVSLTASKDFGKLNVSLRERWQYTYRPEQENMRMDYQHADLGYSYSVRGKATNIWRNKLQLKYKTTGLLQPYLYGETYVSGTGFDKLRLSLGTDLKLSKRSSLNVGYVYQKVYDNVDEEGNKHVLSIGYKYKF